jgi:hypothetical protein
MIVAEFPKPGQKGWENWDFKGWEDWKCKCGRATCRGEVSGVLSSFQMKIRRSMKVM